MAKSFGKIAGGVGVLACAAMLFAGCGQRTEEPGIIVEPEEVNITYQFAVVEYGDVVNTEKLKTVYRQMKEQEVSFALSGKEVEHVYVKKGQTVKKGELLAELSGGNLDRRIEELEYRIRRNELLYGYTDQDEAIQISRQWVNYLNGNAWGGDEYVKESVKNIQKNYKDLRADYQDAIEMDRMEMEALKKELKDSKVYAALDGVIHSIEDNLEGSTSKKDKVVMTVIDTSGCMFVSEFPEFAGFFAEDEPVEMRLFSGGPVGIYRLVPYRMEEWGESQFFSVYDGPEGDPIEVGANGEILLNVAKRENVLQIPLDAISEADGRRFVYVLGADNTREVKWVETGLYGNDNVEILSGLEEGEKVIRR